MQTNKKEGYREQGRKQGVRRRETSAKELESGDDRPKTRSPHKTRSQLRQTGLKIESRLSDEAKIPSEKPYLYWKDLIGKRHSAILVNNKTLLIST